MKNTILLNLAFLLAVSALAPAATRLVPDEYATIQAAIDDCNDGDTVIVADGIYTGSGNRDIDFLGKAITVRSIDPNDPNIVAATVIDCQGSSSNRHRGFNFHSGEDANSVLAGFTIINGYCDVGGAILCERSSPTITNCIINRNSAKYYSSGIFCFSSSLTITNCAIRNNTGAGVTCHEGHPIITGCIISGNSAGPGIAIRLGNLTASNCIITGNTARQDGGGICCDGYKYGGTFSITNCIITQNTAYYGAGIHFKYANNATVTNCTISNNSARSGGGIYCTNSYPMIANCTITGNAANRGSGGGIYSSYEWHNNSATISNCTISGNSARLSGGGIYSNRSKPKISNCILWDNSPQQIDCGRPPYFVTYSDVQGGWLGPGNVDVDPCFISPGYWADVNDPNIIVEPNDPNAIWVEGDYHLLEYSPCINAGDPNFVPGPNERDIDGQPRVWDGRVDMGADEFVPMIEVLMKFTPQALNPKSKGNWVKAHLVLPDGFVVEDVDVNRPAVIEPLGIESDYIDVFINEDGLVEIEAGFDRAAFCAAGPIDGTVTVIGAFGSGQYFYGTDTIKIITNNLQYLGVLASHWLEQDCGKPDWCDGIDVDQDSVVNFVDFAMFDGCCIEIIAE